MAEDFFLIDRVTFSETKAPWEKKTQHFVI